MSPGPFSSFKNNIFKRVKFFINFQISSYIFATAVKCFIPSIWVVTLNQDSSSDFVLSVSPLKDPHRLKFAQVKSDFCISRGYSNNTWHFFGTFLAPHVTFYLQKYLFLKILLGFKMWNKMDAKCLLKPNSPMLFQQLLATL